MTTTSAVYASFLELVRSDYQGVAADARVLVEDLVEMFANEPQHPTTVACYRTWLHRIGGKKNLDSYVATLKAGRDRKK